MNINILIGVIIVFILVKCVNCKEKFEAIVRDYIAPTDKSDDVIDLSELPCKRDCCASGWTDKHNDMSINEQINRKGKYISSQFNCYSPKTGSGCLCVTEDQYQKAFSK